MRGATVALGTPGGFGAPLAVSASSFGSKSLGAFDAGWFLRKFAIRGKDHR
jgi:hypothetical protein